MAPSFVKAALLTFFGGLTLATDINTALQKRALLIANGATLPGNWASIGCYLDGASTGRTLSSDSYTSGTLMTEESCVRYCNSKGYYYAGVEYSQECYCGNTLYPSISEPQTDCNMACSGNGTEACGGPGRLNVFWSGQTPPSAPVTNPGPFGWTLIGCYKEGTTGRTLRNGMDVVGGANAMTVAACTYACNQAGYIFAGIEYSQECYCDNAISNGGVPAPLTDCNMICKGNSSEFCGAGGRLDLYELSYLVTTSSTVVVSTTITSTTSKTSTITTSTSTPLTTSTSVASSTSTTKPATSTTSAASSTSTTKPATSTTSAASSASTTKSATSTTSVASVAIPTGPVHVASVGGYSWIGCYTEATGVRALKDTDLINYLTMTVEMCQAFCSAPVAYQYFGLEYSGECYCGNVIQTAAGSALAPTTDCNMLCDGNKYEYCGSGNRLDVYQLGAGGVSSSSSASSKATSPSTSNPTVAASSSTVVTSTSSSTKSTTTTSISTSSAATPTGPVHVASVGGYSWIGCYTEATGVRALKDTGLVNYLTMTVEMCQAFCSAPVAYQYFGLEYSGECYCGNVIQTAAGSALAPTTDCNMLCDGNKYEYCGSGNRLDVYQLGAGGVSSSSSATSKATTTTAVSSLSTSSSIVVTTSSTSGSTSKSSTSTSVTSTSSTSGSTSKSSTSTSVTSTSSTSGSTSKSSTSTSVTSTSSTSGSTSKSSTSTSVTSTSSTSGSTSKSSTSTSVVSTSSTSGSTSVTSTSTSAASTPTGPVHVQNVGGYSWIGCYTEATGVRALKDKGTTNYKAMTVEMCQAFCSSPVVYTYFGVEYGGECYCGNVLQTASGSTLAPTTDCSMLCDGNKYEYCGAGNRLDVYQVGPGGASTLSISSATGTASTLTASTSISTSTSAATNLPQGWKYDGCYIDGANGRILQYGQPDSQTNTVESCVNTCIGLGYTIAGMEFSTQCFCDNHIYNGGVQTSDSDCDMACPGNSNEMCGAGDRLSVYNTGTLSVYQPPAAQKTGLPGSWTYQGCYTDNLNDNRALFWQLILTNNNTATNCLGMCAEYGYMAGGMEYGDECYCGDMTNLIASGSTQQPEIQCQVPCSGNPQYICGDGNRLSLYVWTGTPLYVWHTPTGPDAGEYQFFVPGLVVPLMTSLAINNKVTFLEKFGTGIPNATGAYELDLSLSNNFNLMWREMHVKTDVFCSAGITLPDKAGRQLTIGGWAGTSTFGVRLYWPDGSPGVNGTNDWQEDENELTLQTGRWYPSAMVLSNGSVLVMGGEVGSNAAANPTLEVLPLPAGGYVKYLDWLARTNPDNLYPFMFVLPSGNIFVAYYNEARILDPVTFDTITQLPNIPGSVQNFLAGRTYPLEGTAVMLPQHAPFTDYATILICGGSANGAAFAIDNCVSIQPDNPASTWTIERMPSQRVMSCIAALPDGTYLILNGATEGVAGFGLATGPNLGAVLYDPSQPVGSRMSIMANTILARLYHSEAILLPDGGVLVSGSDPEDDVHPEEFRVEKFYPPYLLNGLPKPTFTIQNTDWAYGGTYKITVNLPNGGPLRISLMGAVASTHGNSMGMRTLFPAFTCTGNTCQITAPPNSKVLPPAWCQLFVLDGPTPSMSHWVRIGGDPAGLGNWPALPDFNVPGI